MGNRYDLFSGVPHDPPSLVGLHYLPQFLSTDQQIRLLHAIDMRPWSCELKRRVQHYGYRYDYKARRIDPAMYLGPLPDFAVGLSHSLERVPHFAQYPDQLIVNEYLPGQGISAHVDCRTCFNDHIAAVSLGCAYEMEFLELQSNRLHVLTLAPGSLLILAGEARYDWAHRIRARRSDHGVPRQRRVSLTFRKVLL